MTARRAVGIVLGIVGLGLGVLAAGGGPVRAPLGGPIRPAVGALLALAGLYGVLRNWEAPEGTVPPTVERAPQVARPGADIDRDLAGARGSSLTARRNRTQLHDRLRDVAEWTLARERGWSRDRAARTIDRGEWPDDTAVARFLARGIVTRQARSLTDQLRAAVGDAGESPFHRVVRRTVPAIDVRGDHRGEDRDGDAPEGRNAGNREANDMPDGRAGDDAPGPELLGASRRTTTPVVDAEAMDGLGDVRERIAERGIDRWAGAVHLVIVLVGAGIALSAPMLAAAGVVALAVVAHARAGEPAEPGLVVDRTIEPDRPDPGESVSVRTTVRNAGSGVLPDLRLIDGVPEDLAVEDGTARRGTALRSGESVSFEYTVTGRRGTHAFGSCLAITRDLAGTSERVTAVGSEDAITCVPQFESLQATVPLESHPAPPLGRLPTATGDGVSFESTREYRPGDPITRVDWKRVARSGEFATVTYTEERAARVAVVVDARAAAAVSPDGVPPTAVDRCVEAAGRIATTLLDAGDRVGIASMGADPYWQRPGLGAAHWSRIRTALGTHPAFAPSPSGDRPPDWPERFHRRFPRAQLLFVSPLVDWAPLFVLRRLAAYGHPATVVSPDPTTRTTLGGRIAGIDRHTLLGRCRDEGLRVIDWPWDEELDVALARGHHRSTTPSAARGAGAPTGPPGGAASASEVER